MTLPEALTILGLDENVSMREVQKAYRALSLKFHPDRKPDPSRKSEAHNFVLLCLTLIFPPY